MVQGKGFLTLYLMPFSQSELHPLKPFPMVLYAPWGKTRMHLYISLPDAIKVFKIIYPQLSDPVWTFDMQKSCRWWFSCYHLLAATVQTPAWYYRSKAYNPS